VATSMVLLAVTDLSLRVFGYMRVMRFARRISRGVMRVPDGALIAQTIQSIHMATTFYPGRSECLEQAVVGYFLLRRRGIDVKLRIGVQPYPFAAPAWLELNGAVVVGQSIVPCRRLGRLPLPSDAEPVEVPDRRV